MKIQRFEAGSAEEALRQVRAALGPDAVILHTRQVQAVNPGERGYVEVTAAIDAEPPAPRPVPAAVPNPAESEVAALRRELADLRGRLVSQAQAVPASDARGGLFGGQPLFETGPASGPQFLSPGEIARRVRESLRTRTIEMRPGRCTAVALVGPTGVGKTTTLAKLAAAAAHGERKRVAILNLDTYRIGAVEQLEAYARLLRTPLSVAYSVEEVRAARDRYRDFDLLLVDTTGRSPRNEREVAALADLLDAARPDEVHLFLEARASAAAHAGVVRGFRPLRPTHLLLSKLDEAVSLPDCLLPALEFGLPFSYLTVGQRVPEDLAPATCEQLMHWMQGGAAA